MVKRPLRLLDKQKFSENLRGTIFGQKEGFIQAIMRMIFFFQISEDLLQEVLGPILLCPSELLRVKRACACVFAQHIGVHRGYLLGREDTFPRAYSS